jgi:zinc transporter
MDRDSGFVYCAEFDGKGSATEIDGDYDDLWNSGAGTVWFHLDLYEDAATEWLARDSGLSELTVEMLTSDDTRPRVISADGGLVICLRAVNFNPGSDADDMVSLRLWISHNRILTMRKRRVEAINDIRASISSSEGPENSGSYLAFLCEAITNRISGVVSDIDEELDSLEDELLEKERATLRSRILRYRRMIIGLRKYIIPQKETLSRLQTERVAWLSEMDKLRLRESTERLNRCLDDLDAARDRAAMTQEELNARLSEQMNQTIFMMSIVATIFLPLGLITGLLGINVGGVPGTETPWAFLAVCVMLLIIAVGLYVVFKKKQIITSKTKHVREEETHE